MKLMLIAILIAVHFLFPACQFGPQLVEDAAISFGQETEGVQEAYEPVKTEKPTIQTIEPTKQPTPEPMGTPEPTSTEQVTETVKPTETAKPKQTPSPQPTMQPTAKPTEKPTSTPTAKPTPQPTHEPIVEPTPTPTPEPEVEIIPVSSSYINTAMAEINRLREENGVSTATYSGSISSSCQSHAVKMAESGSPFHASGVYMFEAVGRASRHMFGGTMGGSAANHVVQLQSEEVTKIGIGAVYYGDYVFYVVRGD